MPNEIPMVGLKFGRLKVLSRHSSDHSGIKYTCECECGKQTVVYGQFLRNGKTVSCGCYQKECVSREYSNALEEYLCNRDDYKIIVSRYNGMITRCYNENSKSFKDYGGRGIKVCDEWKYNIFQFLLWAITNGFHKDLELDRKDVNGDYSPVNCRWITREAQRYNLRKTKIINYYGYFVPSALIKKAEKLQRRKNNNGKH